MRGSGKVQIKTSIQIYGTGTKMPVTIEADFTNIPHHLHQIYFQSLISQYNTSVNVYNNTKDDEPKTIREKKSEWRLNRIVDIISKAISK
jgi:hypothetical protein